MEKGGRMWIISDIPGWGVKSSEPRSLVLDGFVVVVFFRISINPDECLRFGREQRASAMFGDGAFSNVAIFRLLQFLHDIVSLDKKEKVVGEGSKFCLPFSSTTCSHSINSAQLHQICRKRYLLRSLKCVLLLLRMSDDTDQSAPGARIDLCGRNDQWTLFFICNLLWNWWI